jgi:hypothetical protein
MFGGHSREIRAFPLLPFLFSFEANLFPFGAICGHLVDRYFPPFGAKPLKNNGPSAIERSKGRIFEKPSQLESICNALRPQFRNYSTIF